MKHIIKNTILFIGIIIGFANCNDSFLDRDPTHNINDFNYWKTESDLKVYNNGIYNAMGDIAFNSTTKEGGNQFFRGHGDSGYNSSVYSSMALESQSDNFASLVSGHAPYVRIAAGQETIPTEPATGGWVWSFLRRCNIFLANYDRAEISQDIKDKYAGEVYFFRAWFYLDKVQKYGNVPLVTAPLDVASPELYEKQTNRKAVMDHVLNDIAQAIKLLPEDWPNDPDRVTKSIALALKSRICLYEGTYRKYHNLGDETKFLEEAVKASDELIKSGKYSIYNTGNPESDYRTLFTSPDLKGNEEVIMAKVYNAPGLAHRISGYTISQAAGATKDFVDDFLCLDADGKVRPVSLSQSFKDDKIEDVFDNRDPRLAQTILDPRKEREILHTSNGYPKLTGMTGWESTTGYHLIKFYDYADDLRGQDNEVNDYPIFRYAEILLNHAEAKAELGTITQADLDITINELRDRVSMPHLDLNPELDPKYADEGVSSLLVEIRRERRIELSFEDFRYQDLMRWKKGKKLAEPVLGMRLEDADLAKDARYEKANGKVHTIKVNGKKYIDVYAGTGYATENRVFDDNKHYLHPIPINAIARNPNLEQTPGWR